MEEGLADGHIHSSHIREKLDLEVLWRDWASSRESYKVGLKRTNAL